MRKFAVSAAAISLLAVSTMNAGAASAAAPANDTSAGATSVSVGFQEVLDTSEATTDAQDAQLNESCGAPSTDASVWYTLVGTGGGVVIDVSASDYPAGVLVGVGSPGALDTVVCGPGAVALATEPGTTYFVLAIDDQSDGAGNGGRLDISFNEAPPPPTVDVTVASRGTVNTRTGVARLTGTYTCSNADSIEIFGDVTQPVGRFAIRGFFDIFEVGTCDGKAATVAFSFACGAFECAFGFTEQSVSLRGGR